MQDKNVGSSSEAKIKYPVRKKRLYTHGEKSLLDLHASGKIFRGSLIVGLYIEKRSHWDKGRSFRIKGLSELEEGTGYSSRHIRRCLSQLEEVGWLKIVSPEGAEYFTFELYPFGEDARKGRSTTSAPLDESCPLSQLVSGKISRSECAAWHYLNVGWQGRLGETVPRSLREWSEVTGVGIRTLWGVFKTSCLFQRISTTTRKTMLKVFPFLDASVGEEKDRHGLSESEVQASYSEVMFSEGGIGIYRGEKYKAQSNGFERWMSGIQKWIYVGMRIPLEVIEAFRVLESSDG